MKPYLLFSGKSFYASGGWNDYQESFETCALAINKGKQVISEGGQDAHEWYQVVDGIKSKVVALEGEPWSNG